MFLPVGSRRCQVRMAVLLGILPMRGLQRTLSITRVHGMTMTAVAPCVADLPLDRSPMVDVRPAAAVEEVQRLRLLELLVQGGALGGIPLVRERRLVVVVAVGGTMVAVVHIHAVRLLHRSDVLKRHGLGGWFPEVFPGGETMIVVGHQDIRGVGVCRHGV